jgi:ketosteroid isomerase-like protein
MKGRYLTPSRQENLPMATDSLLSSDDKCAQVVAEISELHRKRGQDWVQRRADAYLSYYWDDALLFTVDQRIALPELRRAFVALLASGGGPLTIELPEVDNIVISSGGDAATTTFEWRARSRSEDSIDTDRTYYETDVWYRRNGVWKIIRMHLTRLSLREVTDS